MCQKSASFFSTVEASYCIGVGISPKTNEMCMACMDSFVVKFRPFGGPWDSLPMVRNTKVSPVLVDFIVIPKIFPTGRPHII